MTPTFGAMEGGCRGWVGPDCRLLAQPPCRTQASSPAAPVRTLGLPALAHGQLSLAKWTVFRESRLSPAWPERQAAGPMAGADLRPGSHLSCPAGSLAWPSLHSLPFEYPGSAASPIRLRREGLRLSHQTPQGRTASSITLSRGGLCLLQALGLALRPWDHGLSCPH